MNKLMRYGAILFTSLMITNFLLQTISSSRSRKIEIVSKGFKTAPNQVNAKEKVTDKQEIQKGHPPKWSIIFVARNDDWVSSKFL